MKYILLSIIFVPILSEKFKCSEEYERESELYPKCIPITCGRLVINVSNEIDFSWRNDLVTEAFDWIDTDNVVITTIELFSKKIVQDNVVNSIFEEKIESLKKIINQIEPTIRKAVITEYQIENLYMTSPLVLSKIQPSSRTSNHSYSIPHVDLEAYEVNSNSVSLLSLFQL